MEIGILKYYYNILYNVEATECREACTHLRGSNQNIIIQTTFSNYLAMFPIGSYSKIYPLLISTEG